MKKLLMILAILVFVLGCSNIKGKPGSYYSKYAVIIQAENHWVQDSMGLRLSQYGDPANPRYEMRVGYPTFVPEVELPTDWEKQFEVYVDGEKLEGIIYNRLISKTKRKRMDGSDSGAFIFLMSFEIKAEHIEKIAKTEKNAQIIVRHSNGRRLFNFTKASYKLFIDFYERILPE